MLSNARAVRAHLTADPHRPLYHFAAPGVIARPGDVNGMYWANGRYHMMFLYRVPNEERPDAWRYCWGHVSSADLLHWRQHPDAIVPENDDGAYSGGAFVDDDGRVYLSYAMLRWGYALGLVTNVDRDGIFWQRWPSNPCVRCYEPSIGCVTNADGTVTHYAAGDPSNIWKKDGRYFVTMGNYARLHRFGKWEEALPEDLGDRVDLFESDDLKTWRYRHPFYTRNPAWTGPDEDNACTTFMPLPSSPEGGDASGKWLMTFLSHVRGGQYYIGEYDRRDDRFLPEIHGRFSWKDNACFAPETLMDGRGRQLLVFWMQVDRPDEYDLANGWSGVYTLPRTLWRRADGSLGQRPVPELEGLRLQAFSWPETLLSEGGSRLLEGPRGETCEIDLEVPFASAGEVQLDVLAHVSANERTTIRYDVAAHELVFDATASGKTGLRVEERAPLLLAKNEPLRLRVFVDRSIVEVFANDRQAISRRVYPGAESKNIRLSAVCGVPSLYVRAWTLDTTNPF